MGSGPRSNSLDDIRIIMNRAIRCIFCQNKIMENFLFDHLVKKHRWEVLPDSAAEISNKDKTYKNSSNKSPTNKPKDYKLINKEKEKEKEKVILVSSRGTRISGVGKCSKCNINHMENWVYKYSDGRKKSFCRFCKDSVFDTVSNRKTDALDHCIPGSALSGKRHR